MIEAVLARQGVDVVGPSPDSSVSFTNRRDIDFLCAVLPSASSLLFTDEAMEAIAPPAVYLEIGFAIGASIPVLLIVDSDVRLPSSLAGLKYISCDLTNESALEFHLNAFLRTLGREPEFRPSEDKRASPHILARTRDRVREIDEMAGPSRGRAFEEVCLDLLTHCTDSLVSAGRSDRGADLVTWIDPIGVIAVELKVGELTLHGLELAERQLMSYLVATRANLGVVLVHDTKGNRHPATKTSPLVFRMEVLDLIDLLESFSFKRILQTERNALVHGF